MGLFGAGGLKSFRDSVASVIASLVGQDIVAKSITLTQAAASVAVQLTTGARLKLGGGTVDYITSDGASTLTVGGSLVGGGGTFRLQDTGNNNAGTFSGSVAGINANAGCLRGGVANGATAIGVGIGNFPALTTAGAKILAVYSDSFTTEVLAVDRLGKLINATAGDSTGAPGAATLNTPTGRSAIALGAASVVITNSLVSATSIVFAVLQTADATLLNIRSVVPGAGTFTITGNAVATADTNVGWIVLN